MDEQAPFLHILWDPVPVYLVPHCLVVEAHDDAASPTQPVRSVDTPAGEAYTGMVLDEAHDLIPDAVVRPDVELTSEDKAVLSTVLLSSFSLPLCYGYSCF